MKWFNAIIVRTGIIACVAVVILIGLYSARFPYLDSCFGSLYETDLIRKDRQVNPNIQCTKNSQDWGISSEYELVCNLPDGWQTHWKGGKLWITHYNPNGSIADSLPFESLENFYQWFETHPDCCDVDVEKLTIDKPECAEKIAKQAD
jgi:hypothetical protein